MSSSTWPIIRSGEPVCVRCGAGVETAHVAGCPVGEVESVVSEGSTSRSAEALEAPVRESQRVAAVMMLEFPDLSRRTRHVLQRAGVVSAHALLAMSDAQLLRLPNFGRGSLSEVRRVRARLGGGREVPASVEPSVPAAEDLDPLASWSIEDRITSWRAAARAEARRADSTEDAVDSIHAAAKATMYLALAADAERFGELPPVAGDGDD